MTSQFQVSTVQGLTHPPGFGGLAAAIECHGQGHEVEIFESFAELKQLGDIITFGSNAGRIFGRWGNGAVTDKFRPLSIDTFSSGYGFNIHKYDTGEIVLNQPSMPWNNEAPYFSGHRGEFHEVVFRYAKDDLAIPIQLGRKIEKYFEDDREAGIILENGERVCDLIHV